MKELNKLELITSDTQWKEATPQMLMPLDIKMLIFELADMLGKKIVWREEAEEEALRPGMYAFRQVRKVKLGDKDE